jgi:hypothetical protein
LDIGKMITKELKLVHAGEEMYGFGDWVDIGLGGSRCYHDYGFMLLKDMATGI